jgi:hypothetical protein
MQLGGGGVGLRSVVATVLLSRDAWRTHASQGGDCPLKLQLLDRLLLPTAPRLYGVPLWHRLYACVATCLPPPCRRCPPSAYGCGWR